MRIKQARLAQALRGETSNLLESSKYDMTFEKGILFVELRNNPKKFGKFMVLPANLAWLEYHEEIAQTQEVATEPESLVVTEKKPARNAKK